MKSVIVNQEAQQKEEIKYPYLGEYNGEYGMFVVLFTSPKTGVVVYSNYSIWRVGEGCSMYTEIDFSKFNGTVELSN